MENSHLAVCFPLLVNSFISFFATLEQIHCVPVPLHFAQLLQTPFMVHFQ
jgi:hypothetical protein